MREHVFASGVACLTMLAAPRAAGAADAAVQTEHLTAHEVAMDRIRSQPHTTAEVEAGVMTLPNAPISSGQRGGDTPFGTIGRGDATLQTGLHFLYRWERRFAVGAGFLFAPLPTSDPGYGGLGALARTHARSYFLFGGEGRYVPIHYRSLEAWVGASAGGVITADRYTTDTAPKVPTVLGSNEVTIRTEGLALGVQVGASYALSESWVLGASVRGYYWLLPATPRCSSLGDCATLSGSVAALAMGIALGYRLPL